jgi:hypothetical protein
MRFNLNQPIPLLFLGDSPDSHGGLGRIGHDLAWLASSMPEFEVGYLGRGAFGSSRFPWTQYAFGASDQWGEAFIERAWNNLSKGRKGIILTIWDASRLLWFADGKSTGLEAFLNSGQFEKWGYFMADAAGVSPNTLPLEQAHVVSQYDRAVFASRWAYNLAAAWESMRPPDMDWIPHPINRETFHPRGRDEIRSAWGVDDETILVGCVMANQQRKSWPVVIEAFSLLAQEYAGKARLWVHTDKPLAYWNLPALAVEYGVSGLYAMESRGLTDHELAMRYSACDVTLVISGGEGFCYPVAESLSCGAPCVVGSYGAADELSPWRVEPVATAIETSHNVRRAIYSGSDVCKGLMAALAYENALEQSVALVQHLNHKQLGLVWQKWLRKGLL